MEVSQLDTPDLLLAYIAKEPGIRYRELLRLTGLANGVLTYHLSALEKSSMVRVDRQSGATRYYPLNVPEGESHVLGFVRHGPVREIISFILANDSCTFAELVDHTGKAPSTVSSHLKRLKEAGIVRVRYGEYQLYSLANRDLVADVLAKYRATYADRVVDNYVEMLDEL
ncbi:winged helix-turn-helix transcriptional regulator [Nitrososphaera sp.]|uniref:winged helix-turn-helix transcriptional regulator n=1 Tax=Nitrososphaera sp. TaxID=1971748 RepID=UPI0017D32F35|nr:winged helix-turn-helix transcriptional regulator [Nitrososphaera sp.]NWG37383.1 winged helix-turn-helix transcriptional regulator [Nitrososphaera sp.]